jgi:hypothetical protein
MQREAPKEHNDTKVFPTADVAAVQGTGTASQQVTATQP